MHTELRNVLPTSFAYILYEVQSTRALLLRSVESDLVGMKELVKRNPELKKSMRPLFAKNGKDRMDLLIDTIKSGVYN